MLIFALCCPIQLKEILVFQTQESAIVQNTVSQTKILHFLPCSVSNFANNMLFWSKINDFKRFLSKRHLTVKVIEAEWWKKLDTNPLDTILHLFASTLLEKGYFLSWKGQKIWKFLFRRFGLKYLWIVYSA